MIGIASLLVAGASEIWLAVGGDVPSTSGIVAQVIVLDCAATSIGDRHSPVVILIDAVAAQSSTQVSSTTLWGVAVSAMRKVFVGLRCVLCTTLDVIVMKKHDSVIEPHAGLRMMIFSAGVLVVLLEGMVAGVAASEEVAA